MAAPTLTKTWTITMNNRITFVSIADTVARYLFGMKAFLKTAGYTVKGSCDGTTGAMDAVDRWATSANAQTHATAVTTAMSWVVLTDANGVDIMIANWNATSTDQAYLAMSPSGVMAVGSPANSQPTATDFVGGATGLGSLGVGNIATNDRVWNGWVDSTNKMFRSNIARQGVWVGFHWGVELVQSDVQSGGPVVFSPTVWLFSTNTNAIPNGSRGGFARPIVASSPPGNGTQNQCYFALEWFGLVAAQFSSVQVPLQGATGYPAIPLGIGMQVSGSYNGRLATLFDWWMGRDTAAGGDTYASKQFLATDGVIGSSGGGGVWPWDGATTPVVT
jgi:hypothetical protein